VLGLRECQGGPFGRGLGRADSCSRSCCRRCSGFLLAMVLVADRVGRRRPRRSDAVRGRPRLRILQFASASAVFRSPWRNDAQKTMGIIAVLLYSQASSARNSSCRSGWCCPPGGDGAPATLMGGWRIVRTMGLRITKLTPMQGFCAGDRGSATLAHRDLSCGVPVPPSIPSPAPSSASGAAHGAASAVRWNVASSIVYGWVITISRLSGRVAALAIGALLLVR